MKRPTPQFLKYLYTNTQTESQSKLISLTFFTTTINVIESYNRNTEETLQFLLNRNKSLLTYFLKLVILKLKYKIMNNCTGKCLDGCSVSDTEKVTDTERYSESQSERCSVTDSQSERCSVSDERSPNYCMNPLINISYKYTHIPSSIPLVSISTLFRDSIFQGASDLIVRPVQIESTDTVQDERVDQSETVQTESTDSPQPNSVQTGPLQTDTETNLVLVKGTFYPLKTHTFLHQKRLYCSNRTCMNPSKWIVIYLPTQTVTSSESEQSQSLSQSVSQSENTLSVYSSIPLSRHSSTSRQTSTSSLSTSLSTSLSRQTVKSSTNTLIYHQTPSLHTINFSFSDHPSVCLSCSSQVNESFRDRLAEREYTGRVSESNQFIETVSDCETVSESVTLFGYVERDCSFRRVFRCLAQWVNTDTETEREAVQTERGRE